MSPRYEVNPSGGLPSCPPMPNRWCVQAKGEVSYVIRHVSYALACAVARHLNGHDPEAGDVEALVNFALGYQGEAP